MSFYRTFVAAIAAMGLATAAFAADEATTASTTSTDNSTPAAQQVAMADQSTTTTTTTTTEATDQQSTKIDLNKATVKQLSKVKGLTSAKARSIVAYRKRHGEFKTLDDLSNVKGFKKMNEETLKRIQDQLTIG